MEKGERGIEVENGWDRTGIAGTLSPHPPSPCPLPHHPRLQDSSLRSHHRLRRRRRQNNGGKRPVRTMDPGARDHRYPPATRSCDHLRHPRHSIGMYSILPYPHHPQVPVSISRHLISPTGVVGETGVGHHHRFALVLRLPLITVSRLNVLFHLTHIHT